MVECFKNPASHVTWVRTCVPGGALCAGAALGRPAGAAAATGAAAAVCGAHQDHQRPRHRATRRAADPQHQVGARRLLAPSLRHALIAHSIAADTPPVCTLCCSSVRMLRLKQRRCWCRNPPAPGIEVPKREVWAVPDHLVLRNSVEEVQLVRPPHFALQLSAYQILTATSSQRFYQAAVRCNSGEIARISHLQYLLSASAAAFAAHVWPSQRITPDPSLVHGGLAPHVTGLQACEEAAHEDATPERFLEPWQKDGWRLRGFVRDQLLEAGVQDAGAIWGTEREATHPVYAVCRSVQGHCDCGMHDDHPGPHVAGQTNQTLARQLCKTSPLIVQAPCQSPPWMSLFTCMPRHHNTPTSFQETWTRLTRTAQRLLSCLTTVA